jgi:FKBP-type peptidyl-prolyl cis-trans isomerase FkpA
MKRNIKLSGAAAGLAFTLFLGSFTGCTNQTYNKPIKASLKNNTDSASYALGAQLGNSLKRDGLDTILSIPSLMQGIQNGILDTSGLDDQQIQTLVQNFFQKEMEKKNASLKATGDKFLAENGKKPGVTTTASGLQYEVIKEGSGAKPTVESVVSVNYKGSLLSGKVFDESQPNSPVEFPVGQVIPGWIEGIPLMTVGSKYKFYIPGELGYGPQGNPQGGIGPNEVLVFEVELLEIKPGNAQPATPPIR